MRTNGRFVIGCVVAGLGLTLVTAAAQPSHQTYESGNGSLLSVLKALNVPLESQIVTFSQASLHGPLISDMYPRAIYFNDEVAVAWTPRAPTIEVIAYSPARGPMFYTVDRSSAAAPTFKEETSCRTCHVSSRTLGVPGPFMLSSPIDSPTSLVTDHRTPLRQRWGSWYVTGLSRRWKHQGNRIGQGWLESLYDQFDTTGFPTLHSDMAALMVFEHQARVTNLITRARTDPGAIDELVNYMLFVDEAEIPERIVSTSGFAEWFSKRQPQTADGRSLFQLDLRDRLFRYPLSYMIYSRVFDSLPRVVKSAVYARLAVASSDPDRKAALDILESTKPEFAKYRHGD